MASHEIGRDECINCGAIVAFKVNVAGAVFYRCEGGVDPNRRACGLKVQAFGQGDSEKLIAKFKKRDSHAIKSGPHDGGQLNSVDAPEPEISTPKPKPERKRKPEPEPEPKPERKSRGGHDELYD